MSNAPKFVRFIPPAALSAALGVAEVPMFRLEHHHSDHNHSDKPHLPIRPPPAPVMTSGLPTDYGALGNYW